MSAERYELKLQPIDEVAAGATLAEAIRDAQGSVLLPAGAVLTETALASLRQRGVQSIPLRVRQEISAAEEAARSERIEKRLHYIFRNVGDCAAAHELQRQVSEYRRSCDHEC